jgi:hypothetical protein
MSIGTPTEITEKTILHLLLVKSKNACKKEFAEFNGWRVKKGLTAITANVLSQNWTEIYTV